MWTRHGSDPVSLSYYLDSAHVVPFTQLFRSSSIFSGPSSDRDANNTQNNTRILPIAQNKNAMTVRFYNNLGNLVGCSDAQVYNDLDNLTL